MFTWEEAMLASRPRLSQPTKTVLLVLRTYTNSFGKIVWPSQMMLADMCSMTTRALRTHLAKAEAAGWLKRVKLSEARQMIEETNGRKPVKRKSAGRDWAACAYECCYPVGHALIKQPQGNHVPPISGPRPERGSPLDRNHVPASSIVNKHPTPNSLKKNPLPPLPVDNGDKLGVVKTDKMGKIDYDIGRLLTDSGWLAARAAAPGWDVHRLAGIYNAGVHQRGKPRNPDKAFAAWAKAYTKGIRL